MASALSGEKTALLLPVEAPRDVTYQRRQRQRRASHWLMLFISTGMLAWLLWQMNLEALPFKHKHDHKHGHKHDHKHNHKHHKDKKPKPKPEPEVCSTPECIHTASEFLYSLSPNYKELDPCTDFEELVCGGWRETHDLRPDQGDMFTGTLMAERGKTLLRHILEASYPSKSKHSDFSPANLLAVGKSDDEANFVKLQTAYDACMDETAIAGKGLAPLSAMIETVKKHFPTELRNATQDDAPAIKETITLLQHAGVGALVLFGVGADDTNPDVNVVQIAAPYRVGLPSKERYEDPKLLAQYSAMIHSVMSAVLPDQDANFFGPVAAFEKLIAEVSPSQEERENPEFSYNPMSLDKAAELAPIIDIKGVIGDSSPEKHDVDRVIVNAPEYLKGLNEILLNTPLPVLQNYFVWKTIQSFASYVEADAIKPLTRFNNELAGKAPDSAPERWRTCVSHVDEGLGWILSRFFIEKAFSAKAKEFGDNIVSDIKTEFSETLENAEWMDKKVRELAIEKVHNIVQKIGYPTKSPNILDPAALQKYYASVNVSETDYLNNELSMRSLGNDQEWEQLGKPVDRDAWGMTASTVNAYYNPPGNEIVFPAGIMQPFVFDVNVPEYLSYGAFGSVAGHELSHAFDSTGRHYDQNGNYTDWWTNSTVKNFKEKAECFVKQYSNFTVDGPDGKTLHVNGRLTLGENIADAGGVSAAFSAWKKRAAKKPNQNLPGMEHFTQEQLFFVSYGSWWCGKSRPASAVNRIYTDPHAPVWARILGTTANSKDFLEAFQCPNKKPVCQLW